MDARGWLTDERRRIDAGNWIAPGRRNRTRQVETLGAFATVWLADRPLKPSTRHVYRRLLDEKILPALGEVPLKDITPLTVRHWYAGLSAELPTRRAHAYALLRSILGRAVSDGLIDPNPCHIRGAGSTKRVHQIKPATLVELEAITVALPCRYRLMALLASWCAMRFGELIELRRSDIDMKAGKIMIRRAAVEVNGEMVIGTPKSAAGVRDVAIPPHLLPAVREHLADVRRVGQGRVAVPRCRWRAPETRFVLQTFGTRPRKAAARPDLRFHDLHHTGAVLAAQTGATLAELMGRLGHSTPAGAPLSARRSRSRRRNCAAAVGNDHRSVSLTHGPDSRN